jgi:hypothetical protein
MAQMTLRSRCHGTNLACSGSEDSETEFGVRLQHSLIPLLSQ